MPDVRPLLPSPASVPGGEPMQTLRASLVAIPFVALAGLVAVLSALIGQPQ